MLTSLAGGTPLERKRVDLKEERGRRDKGGVLSPPVPQSESAARHLAGECACMANTPGGGALIVGVADDGALVGTGLDAEWLRYRIYELTDRRITPDIRVVDVNGVRLLTIIVVEALEPITFNNKLLWRVDTNCVSIDTATWVAGRAHRPMSDSSALPSTFTIADVRPVAIARAREYLKASGETRSIELARSTDADMLRRLNALTADGHLTRAGALLFVGRDEPALDYVRRKIVAGDSVKRVSLSGVAVLEELAEVERELEAANDVVSHMGDGFAIGQFRELPPTAVREAVVNGLAHRDWADPRPTVVEHIGGTLTVTSPGGFVGGVDATNIITHPSQTRNRALADLLAALRIAEREGVGVDRMVRDMVRLGRPSPIIHEIAGPHVRTTLVGGVVDAEWVRFLGDIEPGEYGNDLDVILILDRASRTGWIDIERLAPVLQRNIGETEQAMARMLTLRIGEQPLVRQIAGVPESASPAWTLTDAARRRLPARVDDALSIRARAALAMDWARARGRISNTELADLTGVQQPNTLRLLKSLVERGELRPSRPNARGRGLYYVPVDGKE
ncbi:ATP-binding protein [Agromyces sp. H66]|uniref:ATP-binding protein n=1 Tax=Agromyces sp. H66 TaxID=2529859 RepID=UPI0010A9F9F3|nr:ATP-binding protein [Agromyces sp. H66]